MRFRQGHQAHKAQPELKDLKVKQALPDRGERRLQLVLGGPQGETGPAGPKGDTGAAGAQGVQGIAGPQGPAGPPLPAGTLVMYAAATAPEGYLLANGKAVSRTTYADLFSVIGAPPMVLAMAPPHLTCLIDNNDCPWVLETVKGSRAPAPLGKREVPRCTH